MSTWPSTMRVCQFRHPGNRFMLSNLNESVNREVDSQVPFVKDSCQEHKEESVLKKQVMCQLLVLILCVSLGAFAETSDKIEVADAAFDRWNGNFEFEAYQQRLETALTAYEQLLDLVPEEEQQTRVYIANRLSQGYFELGFAYITDRGDQEKVFAEGQAHALTSLRLDPSFVQDEEQSFRAALELADDAIALFWYGNNRGKYLEFHWLTAISGGMKDVRAAFERAVELDEAYFGGGPWRALGSFVAKVPAFLGGDMVQAKAAFECAIELGPNFLENYVNYAEYYAKPEQEWDIFRDELNAALELAEDPEVMACWPLYNTLALRRAEELYSSEPGGSN